ncbi:MAG: DoxX family protein, partial [Nanoarchaeota archaeon]
MLNRYFRAHHNSLYVVFRVIVGLLFFVHGAQKLFGWFGSKGAAVAYTMFWTAGIVETIAGLLIAVGLFSRLAAVVGGIQMIAAYFIAHYPKGVLGNHGEKISKL